MGKYYFLNDVADYFQITTKTLRIYCKTGKIKNFWFGGKIRIPEAEIRRFVGEEYWNEFPIDPALGYPRENP